MSARLPILLLGLLLTIDFSLATWLQPRSLGWRGRRAQADTMLKVLLGDGRRMFANHFFTKADAYFHSGYYPSLFDQARLQCENHLSGAAEEQASKGGPPDSKHDEHEAEHDFFGKPKDWLDRFSRAFRVTEHTHLSGGGREREILPWLKLAAALDPHQVDTYTVAAYWLRSKLGKVAEAEAFLREGLRANPDSEEILFELGRLLWENHRDAARARNLLEAALRCSERRAAGLAEPDKTFRGRILVQLARLEEQTGNLAAAIARLRQLQEVSPTPEVIQRQIAELQQRLEAPPPSGHPAAPPSMRQPGSDR